jgi:Leucine-rich repeat (LRR) protein
MNNNEKSKGLQVLHTGNIELVRPPSGSIKERMTVGALTIARQKLLAESSQLYTVGTYELHETDYRQLQAWANMLGSDVEELLDGLSQLTYTHHNKIVCLKIENGHIESLVWDFDSLTLEQFYFLEGLQIKTLCFLGACPTGRLCIHLSSLGELYCDKNQITRLDLSAVPQLKVLSCGDSPITELDLSAVPQLTNLSCWGNKLTKLDLSAVPLLSTLLCYENQITELDLSAVPHLTNLSCWDSPITELDLSAVPHLTDLCCGSSYLTELDLSAVPQLTNLICYENQITGLDLSALPHLTNLICDENQITELDL